MSAIDMDLLRSFLIVAQDLNITRAARRLFVTQQTLSGKLQRLERALGTTLLVRTTRGVALTRAGEILASGGLAVLGDLDELASRVREAALDQGRSVSSV